MVRSKTTWLLVTWPVLLTTALSKARHNGGEGCNFRPRRFRPHLLVQSSDRFGRVSSYFRIRLDDHVGAGRIFVDRGGESGHVRTLHDEEHVLVVRYAFGMVSCQHAAAALHGLQAVRPDFELTYQRARPRCTR
jgi:hypothetical protein